MIDPTRCHGCGQLRYTALGFMCARDKRIECINDHKVRITWSTNTNGRVPDEEGVRVSFGQGSEVVVR